MVNCVFFCCPELVTMKKTTIFVLLALCFTSAFGQKKQYQVSAIAFYNFENLFDPEDDPQKDDDEFTPTGANHYTEEVYRKKLHNLATVIAQLGTDVNPDGPAILGTAEVENAINMHAGVVESAVVGYPHDIKGQGIYAFVIYQGTHGDDTLARQDITKTVSRIIGAIAKPDKIQFVSGLPKTRSGKIMRRILRKIAEGEIDKLGDTTTLLDPNVVDEIAKGRL